MISILTIGRRGSARLAMVGVLVLTFAGCDLLAEVFGNVEPAPEVVQEENYVDLRPRQTPIRNQGPRTTCIVFAAVAATEAAYMRSGYGELDLSEEFINFTRKAFYLHPIWDDLVARAPDPSETQLGSSGGGGGTSTVELLARGFGVPLEGVMPYLPSGYSVADYPALGALDPNGPDKQFDVSTFNLDSGILDATTLRAEAYYTLGTYRSVGDPRNPEDIENALRRGYEVVWDFTGSFPTPGNDVYGDDAIWRPDPAGPMGGHAMLIVGFDRRDSDPDNHYFMVKNSWGTQWTADSQGFTYMSYDYVRQYGVAANYIVSVGGIDGWPELAFIGRWDLNYDGFRGTLDIYHLPGLNDQVFQSNFRAGVIDNTPEDLRIGSFYDAQGVAHHVNGFVKGNRIEFYIDAQNRLRRWNEIGGRKFVYYLDGNDFMAGIHTDTDGRTYAGYARKEGFLADHGTRTPRPFTDGSYVDSTWELYTELESGTVSLTDGSVDQTNGFYRVSGIYVPDGSTLQVAVDMNIPFSDTSRVFMQIASLGPGREPAGFTGEHFSWEDGIITGEAQAGDGVLPFRLIRQKG